MAKKDFKTNISSGIDVLLNAPQKKETTEKEYVKYNYVIEKNFHKTLKLQSALQGRPIVEMLNEALRLYFETKKIPIVE